MSFSRFPALLGALLLAVLAYPLLAAAEPAATPQASQANPSPAAEPTPTPAPSIKELPDGNVEVNGIFVDRKARSVRFPARVNMDEGFVEYYLVTPNGKTHESVLVTEVQPNDLHIAMLLLGAHATAPADPKQAPPANIGDDWLAQSRKLTGDSIQITVTVDTGKGEPERLPAERWLVLGEKEQKPVPAPKWIYNGSMLIEGRFLAQDDGSLISLIRDPSALVNNSLPEAARDDAWLVAKKSIPKEKSPVTVEIRLQGQAQSEAPKPSPSP